ncbi:hypothetical protein O181_087793 [Austropuccinia psidii MF-1]|uniref:Reverse transcriptase domain-containing protein n=1 Tax=Austropuccinia psidii MF-1 TaxID=1389203 RepID=A0A9Q3IQC5_9BASI|nr:hypothetical protein [Austropuccinia psidii MF-1]
MLYIPNRLTSFVGDFLVIDTPKGEDLILGFDFLNNFNPSIYLRKGLITLSSDHKNYYYPSKSFSNDFSSFKSCAALVGDPRTPSFPSSIHIPSLNSNQSLPSSRDEVCGEIQDFGEHNSVSSLHLFFGNMDLPPSSYHDSLEELWYEEEEPEEVETVMKVVPSVYHHYLDVFSKVKAEELPPHRTYTLRAYISENVEKCFIWPSSFSTGEPVLFVKKKDGGLHLCVDYHKLNAATRNTKYPIPPINNLLNVFNDSSIFSNIDLHGTYNLLRIKEGDEHLTAFRTKYGSYEYLIMPFGLTNAPASFQNLFNDIFQDLLDVFVVVYLDYIMVFSKSEEEHVTNVSTAPTRLRANNPFAKASKCLFHVTTAEYLSYVVSSEVLKMNQAKVQQILNWPPPRNHKPLQSLFGFANFYHRFIENSSKKISSLTSFLKEDSFFPLNEEALTTLPDALSCWDNVYPEGEDFIKQDEVKHSRYLAVKVESFSILIDSIQKALWQDSQYRSILQKLGKGKSVQDYSLNSSSQLLLLKDWVVVPNNPTIQLSILQKRHDSPLAGHPGQEKTLKLVKRDFHWSGMTQFIKDYASSC